MVKQKGFADYLRDDPSLLEKYTYEEYERGDMAPRSDDVSIEEAYAAYCEVLGKGQQ